MKSSTVKKSLDLLLSVFFALTVITILALPNILIYLISSFLAYLGAD